MKTLLLALIILVAAASPSLARGGHGGGGHGGGHGGYNNGSRYNHNYNYGRYGYRAAPVYPVWVWVPGYGWTYRPAPIYR